MHPYFRVHSLLEIAAPSQSDREIVNHIDNRSGYDLAPIHVASLSGSLDILKLLLHHGANVDAVDGQGRSCLHCATLSGQKNALKYLLGLEDMYDDLLDLRDILGLTCLHYAVKGNHIEYVTLLLSTSINVFALTPDGLTVYEMATLQRIGPISRMIQDYISRKENNFSDSLECREKMEEICYCYLSIANANDEPVNSL